MLRSRSRPPLRWVALLAALLLAALTLVQPASALTSNTDVRRIAEQLQCPVCEGTSVADSPSPVAVGMRDTIRTKLDAGESEKAILAFFVERYGPAILRKPPTSGFYSAVWWVPFLAIGLGAVMIYGVARGRKSRQSPPAGVPVAPEVTTADYRERIRDDVKGRG